MEKIKNFFGEVKTEMLKVSWPTRQELMESTTVVIISMVAFAIIVGVIDLIFAYLIGLVLK